jgi:hypothetical protein
MAGYRVGLPSNDNLVKVINCVRIVKMTEPIESVFKVNFTDGTSFEINRKRAALYTFFGELSVYNHVYFELPKDKLDPAVLEPSEPALENVEDDGLACCYVFSDDPQYKELAGFLVDNDFPLILNQQEIENSDREALVGQQMRAMDAFLEAPQNPGDNL